jgi:hypothetical protein
MIVLNLFVRILHLMDNMIELQQKDAGFWKFVQFDGDCWLWTGHRDKRLGYGMYSWRLPKGNKPHAGKSVQTTAHKYAYELIFGKIPNGLELDHLCRNRPCINPFHMELVTHQINVLRGNAPSAINARKVVCKYGHELTPCPRPKSPGSRICRTCSRQGAANNRAKHKQKAG